MKFNTNGSISGNKCGYDWIIKDRESNVIYAFATSLCPCTINFIELNIINILANICLNSGLIRICLEVDAPH